MTLGQELRNARITSIKEDAVRKKMFKKFNNRTEDRDQKINYIFIGNNSIAIENNLHRLSYNFISKEIRVNQKCTRDVEEIETVEDFMEMKKKMKESKDILVHAAAWTISRMSMTESEYEKYENLEA
jgi:hypothetical protein